MAKISVYPTISSPLGDDILIGTDIHHQDATKNFMISDMFAIGLDTSVTKLKIYDPTLYGYGEVSLDNDVFRVKGAPTNTRNLLLSSATGYLSFKKDNYDVKLDATANTDSRTYVLPDANGHVALVETTTLQQVTSQNGTTTNDIFVNRLGIYDEVFEGYANIQSRDSEIYFFNAPQQNVFSIKETGITIKNTSNSRYGLINPSLITDYRNYDLPDKSGTVALTSDLRPYKVFTALLTQTGGSDSQTTYVGPSYGNNLTIGISYTIGDNGVTADFTNVGAPNNNVGTIFIATGTVPADRGDDNTYLTFNGGAPVATVLENTIGNIWFTYDSVGTYYCNSNGLFIIGKTVNTLHQTGNISDFGDGIYYAYMYITNPNLQRIAILDQTLLQTDDMLDDKLIEIRVYNA